MGFLVMQDIRSLNLESARFIAEIVDDVCKRPTKCSEGYILSSDAINILCLSAPLKCTLCGYADSATSPPCPRWIHEKDVLSNAKFHRIAYRHQSALTRPQHWSPSVYTTLSSRAARTPCCSEKRRSGLLRLHHPEHLPHSANASKSALVFLQAFHEFQTWNSL